jgi:hypothetical protein
MDHKIDDASYHEGRGLFASGASLRSIIEQGLASETTADDDKTVSTALGFVDAMFDVLRGAILK